MPETICSWCGNDHPVTVLCTKRPTWGRRGFLALFGAGLVGMGLPNLPVRPRFMGSVFEDSVTRSGKALWTIAKASEDLFNPSPDLFKAWQQAMTAESKILLDLVDRVYTTVDA